MADQAGPAVESLVLEQPGDLATEDEGKIGKSGRRRRSASRSGPSEWPVRLRVALVALVGLLTLTMTGPLMTFDAEAGSGSTLRQIGYVIVGLLAAYAIHVDKAPRRLLVVPCPLVVTLGFCWLSVVWAIDPGMALRRVVLTTLVVWSIFVLTRWQGYDRTLLVLRFSLVAVLVANFLVVKLDPALGLHWTEVPGEDSLAGDWRGMMGHKNAAGLVSALAVLFFVFDARSVPKLVRAAVIGAAGYFLFYSSSRTSVAVCVAALIIGVLFSVYKYRYRAVAFSVLIAGTVTGAVVQNIYSDPFLRTLNDPAAFTGRTQIWRAMWAFYQDNPILGSGFGSFWSIGSASPIYAYGIDWVRDVTQGHNGFLDILVQVGPIGLALVIFSTVVFPIVKLLNTRQVQGATGALLISALIFCLGHNMTESSLFDRDSIGQVFLMFTLALLWTVTASRRRSAGSADLLGWANRAGQHRHRPDRVAGDAAP